MWIITWITLGGILGVTLSVDITKPTGSEVTYAVGDMLHLECEDSEGPLVWLHNGMKITTGDRYQITESDAGKHSVLHLDAVAVGDKGRYVCQVDPFTEDEINVKVEEADQQGVEIVVPNSDSTTLPPGETLSLKCTGGADAELFWAHKGVELAQDSRIIITTAEDINTRAKTSLLSIREVTTEDAGRYECKDREDPVFNVDEVSVVVEAPTIGNVMIIDPTDPNLQVKSGHSITLKCAAEKTTELAWYKGDEADTKAIITDAVEGDKKVSLFTLENAQSDDSGVYTCKNADIAEDKDAVTVKVTSAREQSDDSGPTRMSVVDVVMKIGAIINLECTGTFHVTSAFEPEWAREGDILRSGRKYTISINPNSSSLKIRSTDVSDIGMYTCSFIARDSGQVVGAILFNVSVSRCRRPHAPVHGHYMSCPHNPLYGDTCTFVCNLGYKLSNSRPLVCEKHDGGGDTYWSSPPPRCKPLDPGEVEANVPTSLSHVLLRVGGHLNLQCRGGSGWKKNGYPIYDGSKYTIARDYLIIKYTDSTDRGVYDCNIQSLNSILSGIKKFNVTTLPCPRLPAPPNGTVEQCSLNPVYGETCVFRCLRGNTLHGSRSRTCELLHGQTQMYWTGEEAQCKNSYFKMLHFTSGAASAPTTSPVMVTWITSILLLCLFGT